MLFIVSESLHKSSTVTGVARELSLSLGSFAGTIHPYPTQAEALRKLGDAYSRTRLTPTVKRLFERLLAWRRQGRLDRPPS